MQKSNIKTIFALLIMLMITVCTYTTVSFAKYKHESSNTSVGRVATPIVIFSGLSQGDNQYELALNNINPQTTNENAEIYDFYVSNYLGAQKSEVALSYSVTLSFTGNLPISITLKKDDTNIFVLNDMLLTSTSDVFGLSADSMHADDFTLEIVWKNEQTDSDFAGQVDSISLIVNWQQID